MHLLLLHGSLLGPWSWRAVAERLDSLGHTVTCPDLPFADASSGFPEHLSVIDAALDGAQPTVVVAHSAAGLLAPALPFAPQARQIYLAALLPDTQRSVHEQWEDEPDMFGDERVRCGYQRRLPGRTARGP